MFWDNTSWNSLTVDLGDLSDAEQTKLAIRGVVDRGSVDDYNNWIDGFFAQPITNNTQITPSSYMEIKDASGIGYVFFKKGNFRCVPLWNFNSKKLLN